MNVPCGVGMPRLAAALATHHDWNVSGAAGGPEVIERIEGGLTNEVYLLQWADRRLVLRLSNPDSGLGLNREAEERILHHACAAQLAPTVIFMDPRRRVLVTEFIDGHHWSVVEAGEVENIERLVKLLKRIHALPSVDTVLQPYLVAERYWRALASVQLGELISPDLRSRMRPILAQAQQFSGPARLCHNDLMLANLIDSGDQLYALDWEYAAMGDPMFDLAVIAHNHQLNHDQVQWLLCCYFGEIDDQVHRHFSAVLAVYVYLDCLWYAVQGSVGAQPGLVSTAHAKVEVLSRLVGELGLPLYR